jgi:hypothetical protein
MAKSSVKGRAPGITGGKTAENSKKNAKKQK